MPAKPSNGFTLTELCTVVAVIFLVASLLIPAVEQAKGKIRDTLCLHNLHQWGIATFVYATEHDGYLPDDGAPNPGPTTTNLGWYIQLPRQMGIPRYHGMAWRTNPALKPDWSVWICPDNPRRSNGRNLFHYCLNQHVNGTGRHNQPTRLSNIQQPSKRVWLFDSKNLPAVGSWSYLHTNLHGGGAQVLFLDGHAARFSKRDYWDFTSGHVRIDFGELIWIPSVGH